MNTHVGQKLPVHVIKAHVIGIQAAVKMNVVCQVCIESCKTKNNKVDKDYKQNITLIFISERFSKKDSSFLFKCPLT